MKIRTPHLLTLLGLLIAALAIVVPIIWDRYRTKTAVELRWLGTAPLVDESVAPDKLQVFYDGKPIKSVAQFQFAIVNAGRTPIRGVDFITPITVTFLQQAWTTFKGVAYVATSEDKSGNLSSLAALGSARADILDVRVTRTQPSGVDVSASIDPDRTALRLKSTLLNPGDSVEISAVVAGSSTTQLEASGRIVGVPSILVDKQPPIRSGRLNKFAVPVVVLLPLLFGAVSILGLFYYAKVRRLDQRVSDGTLRIPASPTKTEIQEFIDSNFSAIKSSKSFTAIQAIIEATPIDEKLDRDQVRRVEEAIRISLMEWRQSKTVFYVFAAMAVALLCVLLFVPTSQW
jgi:hypothetical protein